MAGKESLDPQRAIGQSVEELALEERIRLGGKHIAREIYTPESAPHRRIEAIGDSVEACVRMLRERGLDPRRFEYTRLNPPY